MNLPAFLSKVDGLTGEMTQEQLCAFVHETARTLPEEERNRFLSSLKAFAVATDGTEKMTGETEEDESLAEEVEAAITELKLFTEEDEDGELKTITKELNEEYDDWYDDYEDEFEYFDPYEFLDDVVTAIDLVHRCVDEEAYSIGCRLVEALAMLTVSVESDAFNGEQLDVGELQRTKLLEFDFKKLVMDSMVILYMGNEAGSRAQEMIWALKNYDAFSVFSLEAFFQYMPHEAPDTGLFLTTWLEQLVCEQAVPLQMIKEAWNMLNDDEVQLSYARQYLNVKPELMEQYMILHRRDTETEPIRRIGDEALETIPVNLVVRGRIAILTATLAARDPDADLVPYWLEAFRSNSTMTNFFRLLFCGERWQILRPEVLSIMEERSCTERFYYDSVGAENRINLKDYCSMAFFVQDFDRMIHAGMENNMGIGWSSYFMKEGISLLLLLLYKGGDDIALKPGLNDMMIRAESACAVKPEAYQAGTRMPVGKENNLFRRIFTTWKATVQISDSEWKQLIDKIATWINQRVNAIMDKSRTNYYAECASFIAALGEVRESDGETLAKQKLMLLYKDRFSRRRNFIAALKSYGMR